MKVRATRLGYYGLLRRYPGDEFVLKKFTTRNKKDEFVELSPEQQFSPKWMEKVDGTVEPKPRSSKGRGSQKIESVDDQEVI